MHNTSQKQFLPHGPLLATKLHMPSVAPHLIVRPRLLTGLSQGMKYRLTLLSAPAGYGKTMLLATWPRSSSHEHMPVA
jgi:LuxR family transcriptional regulator, maltose regulon positive regulatory protein